ncbi:MAG: DNA repair protein RecN [Clostridiaceae bacterium]|nr:DNA repair protein RecN [Clostridiaceae bacterium]
MLIELEVKNFALIDQLNINFENGLNILTGETGAGKSIIIDAVNMAIGERADRQFVREGSKKSTVQAVFSTEKSKKINEILEKYGIEQDNEDILIVTREIYSNGRSTSRINGVIINQSTLKIITQKLIDIHGQHQHQSLLNTDFHIDLLDAYGGNEISKLLNMLSERYKKYVSLKKKLSSFCYDEMERERKTDLLKFQIEEIDAASLKLGEEEELKQQKNLLSNSEKIYTVLSNVYEDFYDSSMGHSLLDNVGKNVRALQDISSIDADLSYFYNTLEEIQYKIEDITREIRNYKDQIDFNPQVLQDIENRLDTINNLKRKYGNSIDEILNYREKIYEELESYTNSQEKINEIKIDIDKEKRIVEELSIDISVLREKAAKFFEKSLIEVLEQLNMKKVDFVVAISQVKDDEGNHKYSYKGIDKVEFMLSTNIGESLKPLSKIASGGEMSRIMLAFKTLLADLDNIPTLIFDEIDTGISGLTAQTVGEKLYNISKNHQVICITHLPQIAAMADTHFLIEKSTLNYTTETKVIKMDKKKRVEELGRLLGGEITEITLKHAEEMINKARKK